MNVSYTIRLGLALLVFGLSGVVLAAGDPVRGKATRDTVLRLSRRRR